MQIKKSQIGGGFEFFMKLAIDEVIYALIQSVFAQTVMLLWLKFVA